MKLLIPTISCLVGLLLPSIFAWVVAFLPWGLFVALCLCLIAMSFASNYKHAEACQAEGEISEISKNQK